MSVHRRHLVDLAARRLLVSDRVAAAKFGTGKPIDDPVRERQALADVRAHAAGLGLDADRAVRFFEDQIAASKVVQRGLFARWREHPAEAPTSAPDLAAVRAELDQLTRQLLARLEETTEPACVSLVDGLDALHREALTTALRSVMV
ncbi:gamma subclass chorismate mutase AroQ [Kutzneria sp. 744]|uniref:gamma subclass chorismate mutase AroQ n=1 Tax=Kutzneria sp. (strain 744) TaxID=345341 RepID=UPI000694BB23|nr:gamma subclass chorismate mutase AroQ [Kutzneria sp. 744]